jgi:hypothetical protein
MQITLTPAFLANLLEVLATYNGALMQNSNIVLEPQPDGKVKAYAVNPFGHREFLGTN